MVSDRKLAKPTRINQCPPPTHVIIENLLSSFYSSQELKLLELKSLYNLLVHLSLDPAISCTGTKANLSFPEIKIGLHGISVSLADICTLSDVLFKIAVEMFKEFLSTLHNVSASFSEQDSLHYSICSTAQRLNLLLRCCIVMLKLLVLDQNRLVENGLVLHAILAKLCSFNFNLESERNTIHFEKVSQEYKWDDTHLSLFTEDFVASFQFIEPIDHSHHFFCTMLEVFVDELLADGQLREYFKLIDSRSTVNKLFISNPNQGDIGSVLELVCIHFCMSFPDEQTFESIDDQLFGFQRGKSRVPELGLLSALTLLLNPVMLMAPKYLQAYLISLVSESITTDLSLQNDKLIDCYLAAFERSVILYIIHMSPSDRDSVCKISAYKGSSQPSFESYLRPVTGKQLDHQISKLDDSLQLQLEHRCMRSKSDLISSCIAHVSDSKEFLNTFFEDEIVSISSSIIVNAFPEEVAGNASYTGSDTKPGSIYLLASILKLMSCSLFQATRYLMHTGDLDCSKALKDLSTCKEHDLLMDVIGRFQNCTISLPIQKSLITAMDIYTEKHKELKLMLINFSGLLSLAFKSDICFLLKGCIAVIVAIMNLFLFEEGNLHLLRLADGLKLSSSNLSKENGQEAVASKRSSIVIASKYEKVRALYLRPLVASSSTGTESGHAETLANPVISDDPDFGIEEEIEEDCNGRIFLKYVMKNWEKLPDYDDLADFIQCKKGKDYSGWLKDREMYRKKKCEKMAVIKWKRKKRMWKYMKANRA